LAFCLSALICPLAFGGSFLDMWIAGAAAFILACLQLRVAEKSALYANVFEYAIYLSFVIPALKKILQDHNIYLRLLHCERPQQHS
jgi:uncharacterized membrane protein YjjP (DUF1212 family)